jgi:hypothetical protein
VNRNVGRRQPAVCGSSLAVALLVVIVATLAAGCGAGGGGARGQDETAWTTYSDPRGY